MAELLISVAGVRSQGTQHEMFGRESDTVTSFSDYLGFTLSLSGYAVAHLVDALRYKPEGREFDFQWGV
jgi:hypothetical protein